MPVSSAPPSLRRRFVGGIAWSLIARVFNQGGTLAINLFLANILDRRAFGEYAMVYSTVLSVSAISTLGMGNTATKYIAELRFVDEARTGRIVGIFSAISTATACLAGVILLGGAGRICADILLAPELTSALQIASGLAVFLVLNSYALGVCAGFERFGAMAFTSATSAGVQFVACATGGWLAGVDGAVAGLVLGSGVQWVITLLLLWPHKTTRRHSVALESFAREKDVIWRYGVPSALSGFVTIPALWLANAFLVRSAAGFDQMALYAAANTVRLCILFMPQIVNSVGFSLINNQAGLGNRREYRTLFWWNMALTATLAFLGAAGVFLFSGRILSFFGDSFADAKLTLVILSASAVAEAVAIAAYQVVQSRAEMWRSLFMVSLPRDLTIMVLTYFLVWPLGAAGLALAWLFGWVLAVVAVVVLVRRLGIRAPIISARGL